MRKHFVAIIASMVFAFLRPEASQAGPGKTMRFNFEMAEITTIIAAYSKASGQKFVVDPTVRGKITILNNKEVTLEEAFNLLSTALATNSFAISERGDTMVVLSARNAQRSLLPVLTELPPLMPEKLVTMVFHLKNVSADEVNKRLRVLPSKDGELTPFEPNNRLVVTDWVSNVHRIAKVIAEVDQPPTQAPATR